MRFVSYMFLCSMIDNSKQICMVHPLLWNSFTALKGTGFIIVLSMNKKAKLVPVVG